MNPAIMQPAQKRYMSSSPQKRRDISEKRRESQDEMSSNTTTPRHLCMDRSRARQEASLEVLIKGEVTSIHVLNLLLRLLWGISLLRAGHNTGFLVVSDALLEEVGLSS
jgi:hypothetical protein